MLLRNLIESGAFFDRITGEILLKHQIAIAEKDNEIVKLVDFIANLREIACVIQRRLDNYGRILSAAPKCYQLIRGYPNLYAPSFPDCRKQGGFKVAPSKMIVDQISDCRKQEGGLKVRPQMPK